MDEIRDQRNGKMTMRRLNTGNKSEVLRKLQKSSSAHFERVLPASSVKQNGESRLTLPAWFVREHGGKLLKSVVLRSQSSLAFSWTVSLSIENKTAACALVRFRAGWQAFVSFNGLLEGDTLVFSLTAMSEFEVYLFREDSRSPKEFPSLSIRERSSDSELAPWKKARPSPERRDEQFVAEVKIKGLAKSTSLIAKKKIVGVSEEFPAYTSSQSPPSIHLSSYSNDLHLLESENNRDCSSGGRPDLPSSREPAIGHDKFDMMSDVDTKGGPAKQFDARMKKENEYQDSALADTSPNRQLPRFLKKLAVSTIRLPEKGRSAAFVEIPTKFWKRDSSRLQSVDKLQGIREDSKASDVLHSSKEIFGNDLQQSKMHQGKVFFEKKLTMTCLPPRAAMTLPTLFVQQHGDKFQKYVTLRNVENGKMWTVKINIMFPHNRPQAYFYRGWRKFTVGNDLVEGDRLTFVLVAKSLFHVFILRIGVNPGLSVLQEPNLLSHNPLPAQRETKMSPVPQHGCKTSADGCQKSENPLSGTLLAKNTAVEMYVAKVASDSPDSSQSPSDMDSHYFEPMVQQKELECVSKAVNNSAGVGQDQSMLPHFLKQTTMSNNLEIPISFLTKNYSRLGTRVQLQGIHEESPEYTVDCCSVNSMGRLRVFFRNGWSHFVNENALRVGQGLVFTLTADSFFVVRKI